MWRVAADGAALTALHPTPPTLICTVKNPWPEAQRLLFQFKNNEDLAEWQAYADSELGGQSTAELRLSESSPVRCQLLLRNGDTLACFSRPRAADQDIPSHCVCMRTETMQGTAEFSGRFSTALGEGAHERLKRRWAGAGDGG